MKGPSEEHLYQETSASLRKKQQVEDRTEANAYSAKEWGRALIPLFGIRILVAAAADMECRGDRAETFEGCRRSIQKLGHLGPFNCTAATPKDNSQAIMKFCMEKLIHGDKRTLSWDPPGATGQESITATRATRFGMA
ncbi:uncharacterized protein CIMG_11297 [Coccidioides immitis RS]|uniref:Uncharacterized protein n=1 Tax=Coccidioides immitis (strain RS) TaxID=246410 RepID=A0A0D8JUD7_COCIM|nr:uncharacterized protein CIMG_11297 [Coccidioides immitis RS]KJF60960.1 hypothetical protein CIMG_11297 [Coccidioides immitis RS]